MTHFRHYLFFEKNVHLPYGKEIFTYGPPRFLDQYSLDNLELTSLLFQTGYLTIKEKLEDGELVLSYPNKEVRLALYTLLIHDMGYTRGGGGGVTVRHLRKAFMDNDLDRAKNILTALYQF